MAKRTRLTAPSAAELSELEAGFAAKPAAPAAARGPGMMPPIAQVAADAAALTETQPAEERAERARDRKDADSYREAAAQGRVLVSIPTREIIADELTRDRMQLDPEEMAELKASIRASGLRLPVEVFELSEPDPSGARFGLLSGFRRLAAIRALEAETGDPAHAAIKAIVREPGTAARAYLAMVEENEIRADLSPYERGRVAVLAVSHGAFERVEEAVDGLFHAASKAKRSKIRSFALVHEELGDLLVYPEALTERAGLRLANALRAGLGPQLRQAAGQGGAADAAGEWAALEPWCLEAEAQTKDPRRGGRPKAARPARPKEDSFGIRHLENGVTLRRHSDAKGYYIRFEGRHVDAELLERAMDELARLLGPA
ncbi:ParB N-terminal domain-containing protein [Poseidonocella sp. HB161398]|uniref:ParB/RepB/Spo0J family partition protein n=1 Tax=Poseidonocella sp. HB161398 TaxID=2320855 RepID=UPI0011085C73|nr:ParB N-terminal domain-containing protein [Poseidonocella sp. HB161398]